MIRHSSLLLAIALSACASLLAAPSQADEPKGDFFSSIEIDYDLDLESIDKAVTRAAIGRKWTIVDKEDGRIELNLVHRGYDANLTLVFDTEEIKIYSDSYAVKKNGERKKRKDPEGWIENLEKDIGVFLSREAYL